MLFLLLDLRSRSATDESSVTRCAGGVVRVYDGANIKKATELSGATCECFGVEHHGAAAPQLDRAPPFFFAQHPVDRRAARAGHLRQLLLRERDHALRIRVRRGELRQTAQQPT